jgi:hypothetical protein
MSVSSISDDLCGFSEEIPFSGAAWNAVPDEPGVYVISDVGEVLYVGMAGRDGNGSLRKRLRDHASGQVVNMFAQYLFLARVQFSTPERITHPRAAKEACRAYIAKRCTFRYKMLADAAQARALEARLKRELAPALNAVE